MIESSIIGGSTLILVGLKLFGVIDWNWIWIFTPLWLPIIFLLAIAFIANTIFELMDKNERHIWK